MAKPATAAVLIIGDEVLSGRTKDKNLGFIADYLTAIGIDLLEVRVVADREDDIVAAVNALRARFDYVLTTGGIGPTHDDITADSMAKAFGTGISHHPEAVAILHAHFAAIGREPNESRMRMARIPEGASLIYNSVSKAPGFRIGNVFVMAGIPKVMQAMMDEIAPQLSGGVPVFSVGIRFEGGEGDIAKPLQEIQERFPQLALGSYPFENEAGFNTNLMIRGRDQNQLSQALEELKAVVISLQAAGKARGWQIIG